MWTWFARGRFPSTYHTLRYKEIRVSQNRVLCILELCRKLWTLKNFATARRSSQHFVARRRWTLNGCRSQVGSTCDGRRPVYHTDRPPVCSTMPCGSAWRGLISSTTNAKSCFPTFSRVAQQKRLYKCPTTYFFLWG